MKAETPPHDLQPPRTLVLLVQGEVDVGSTLLDPAGVIYFIYVLLNMGQPRENTRMSSALCEPAVLTCPPSSVGVPQGCDGPSPGCIQTSARRAGE